MGEFTKRVQSNNIDGPRKRSFTPKTWSAAYKAIDNPDEADQDLYVAGLVVHQKLENIRARLKLSTSPSLSATTKLRSFVAASNHNFLVTLDKSQKAIAEAGEARAKQAPDGFRVEELASVKLELPGGFDWTPTEVVESLVDGIEIPIRVTLQGSPDLAGNPRMDQVEWNDISLELNLGVMYRHAEDIWEDCIWNSYKLRDVGRMKVFLPRDVNLIRGYSIGLARRLSLGIAFTAMARKFRRESAARVILPKVREVRAIERQGKKQVIKLSQPKAMTEALEELMVMRAYASEPYYTELLEEPLTTLGGLTLSHLLDAWIVISRASLVLVDGMRQKHIKGVDENRPMHTWLPEYASVFQISALVDALGGAAGMKPADAKRLIEFLTFRGQVGQEIWAQPLVPVGPSAVAPVFAAVVGPNLRRLVDVWLEQLEVALARRGPAFEAHVRAMVVETISTSKVLAGQATCIPKDYAFKPTGGKRVQIDLLFVVGSTVFLGESKCILEPTDTKSVAMHRKTVEEAADQALYRVQTLETHRPDFVADVKRFGIDLPQDFKVVPFVVVSTTTHVGVPVNGVPVVDELILGRFLDGEIEDVALQGHDLSVQKVFKTVFYTDSAEAEARGAQYFASPPQLKRFLNGVKGRLVPVYAINENDWEGLTLALECVPKEDIQAP